MGRIWPMASAFQRGGPQAVVALHPRAQPNCSSARPALRPTVRARVRRGAVTTAGNSTVARAATAGGSRAAGSEARA
jgi:hypothetical protein